MKQLTIDTGVQEFEINGSGVLHTLPAARSSTGQPQWTTVTIEARQAQMRRFGDQR